MQKRRLHNRILLTLTIVSSLLIILFSIILGLFFRTSYIENVRNKLKFESEKVSFEINKQLEVNFQTIISLSQNLASVADPTNQNKITRDQAIELLEKIIDENKEIAELYTVWESQLFDGQDSLFIDKLASDSIGRFSPHWIKANDGKIELQTFDLENNRTYYDNAKDKIHEVILPPFLYRNNAKKVLKIPLVTPILYGNKFLGIIGINITSDWFQFFLDTREVDNQRIAIVNNEGTIIALSQGSAFKGSFFTELILEQQDDIFFEFKQGLSIDRETANYIIIGTPFYIAETETNWHTLILYPSNEIKLNSFFILASIILGGVLLSFIVFILFKFFLTKLIKPINQVHKQLEKLEKGEVYEQEIIIDENEELYDTNQKIDSIRDTFNLIYKINQKLIVEDYSEKLIPKSKKDILRTSINSLIDKLSSEKIKETGKKETEKKSNWVKQGLAIMNESIRISSGSITDLSDVIVSTLAKYMDAMLCGFFMYQKIDGEEFLESVSTYAYNLKKSFKRKINFNEGLIGTCAIERKVIYINKIPNNYIEVSSGLGESSPVSIIILPVEFENEFLGVLEIAFFRELVDYEKEFAQAVIKNIASAIKTVKINLITIELLEKSQKQTEELAVKEQELTHNLEQQKTIQHQYQQRETELNSILNAVNNTMLTVEYTIEGILLTANEKFLKTMHYSLDDIKGANVLDLVKSEREELISVINTVAKGKFVEKIMKRFTKYGEIRWLLSTYTPYTDITGNVSKILYFAIDITDSKLKMEELENSNITLKEEIENIRIKIS